MAQHKKNFVNFIYDKQQSESDKIVNDIDAEVSQTFQLVLDKCLESIPDNGAPADPYKYHAHMGEFVRTLDHAKDAYVKALHAFTHARNTG
jgi:hypothetical protein